MTMYATGMTITKYRHRHHDGNWIFNHISGQTPSQQKMH